MPRKSGKTKPGKPKSGNRGLERDIAKSNVLQLALFKIMLAQTVAMLGEPATSLQRRNDKTKNMDKHENFGTTSYEACPKKDKKLWDTMTQLIYQQTSQGSAKLAEAMRSGAGTLVNQLVRCGISVGESPKPRAKDKGPITCIWHEDEARVAAVLVCFMKKIMGELKLMLDITSAKLGGAFQYTLQKGIPDRVRSIAKMALRTGDLFMVAGNKLTHSVERLYAYSHVFWRVSCWAFFNNKKAEEVLWNLFKFGAGLVWTCSICWKGSGHAEGCRRHCEEAHDHRENGFPTSPPTTPCLYCDRPMSSIGARNKHMNGPCEAARSAGYNGLKPRGGEVKVTRTKKGDDTIYTFTEGKKRQTPTVSKRKANKKPRR